MLYALQLALFAGMVGTNRDKVLAEGPLAFAIVLGMAGGYAAAFLISHVFLRRDLALASLRAISISGPAVPFVGFSVLGHFFGTESAIPIAIAGLVMNLIQVPATIVCLTAATAKQRAAGSRLSFEANMLNTLREPVVWAPLLALLIILTNVHIPREIQESLSLLGRATGGVALFASGIVLYSRHVAVTPAVCVSVLARNIVIPALIWGAALLLGMQAHTVREAVLTLAIPTASIGVILAVQYQVAEQEMASTLFFSTILSFITMGAFIWLTA